MTHGGRAAARRIWLRGTADGNRRVQRVAADIVESTADQAGIELATWEKDETADGVILMRTTASWTDKASGRVRSAVVLRGSIGVPCEWGIVADAEHGWTHRSVSPLARLGLVGEHINDPIGIPCSDFPVTVDGTGPATVNRLTTWTSPTADRGAGVLLVGFMTGMMQHSEVCVAQWPGLITVVLISDGVRRELNEALPGMRMPVGGARFDPAPCDRSDGYVLAKAACRSRATFANLLGQALAARAQASPMGVAKDAAALLPAPSGPSAWRRKTRDALVTMQHYAEAKRDARAGSRTPGPDLADLLAFARAGTSGSLISANIIILAESDTVSTSAKFRQARTFPVQPETSPTGFAFHAAHIKIERSRPPAPRLHFYDDTDGATGKIYVGYIGPHLPAPRTN